MNSFSVLKHDLASLYGLLGLARSTDATCYLYVIGNAQATLATSARPLLGVIWEKFWESPDAVLR